MNRPPFAQRRGTVAPARISRASVEPRPGRVPETMPKHAEGAAARTHGANPSAPAKGRTRADGLVEGQIRRDPGAEIAIAGAVIAP